MINNFLLILMTTTEIFLLTYWDQIWTPVFARNYLVVL